MKHTLAVVAFALSGMTFITSPVLAETREDPNQVDVSQWQKQEARVCYDNDVKELHQGFSYENGALNREIYRFRLGDKAIYEYHYVGFNGEKKFEAFYVKNENTWIRYSRDEEEKIVNAFIALQKKFFPNKVAVIRCEKMK